VGQPSTSSGDLVVLQEAGVDGVMFWQNDLRTS
jgi:hypothetical protein